MSYEIPSKGDGLLLYLFCICSHVQLRIAEVQEHINGYLNKVQEIEAPGQEEDKAGAAVEEFDEVLGNSKNVADPNEELEEQALALGGPGDPGLADGNGPAQTKANNHNNFAYFSDNGRIHSHLPLLYTIF